MVLTPVHQATFLLFRFWMSSHSVIYSLISIVYKYMLLPCTHRALRIKQHV